MIDRDLARHIIDQAFKRHPQIDARALTDRAVDEVIADAQVALLTEQTSLIPDIQRQVNELWHRPEPGAPSRAWEVSVSHSSRGLVWLAVPLAAARGGAQPVTAPSARELLGQVRSQR